MARARKIHPWPVRLTHWLNALAIILMIGSGWQIYNAAPLFPFLFPIGLGDWLGAGIAWHLACMWLLVANLLVYLTYSGASGHFGKFFPLSPRAVLSDIRDAFTFKLHHQQGVYNAVQKLLYLGVIFAIIVVIASGLAVWKPIQLWYLTDLFGGYFTARYVHFFAMAAIVSFLVIHVAMALMTPKVLAPMLTGGRIDP